MDTLGKEVLDKLIEDTKRENIKQKLLLDFYINQQENETDEKRKGQLTLKVDQLKYTIEFNNSFVEFYTGK